MAKTSQVYLTIFALRPALRLEVERTGTIGTGDSLNQAALTLQVQGMSLHRTIWRLLRDFTPPINVPSESPWIALKIPAVYFFQCVKPLKVPLECQGAQGRLEHIETLSIGGIFIWIRAKG